MPSVKIVGKTADTATIERQNLIEKLAEMVENDKGLYGLNWPGKYVAHNFAYTPTTKTLRPDKANSVDWDNTENLFITGDNLDILKLLRKNYANKIDMIYIDPPYNTGGSDFVYRDNYSDSSKEYLEKTEQGLVSNPVTAGRRHSNWLSMMLPRLLVAKELLKDTGVIFISIDDNEQANLKLLCDEVFGDGNFVGYLKWKRKKQPSFLHGHIAGIMEYIIVCAKCKDKLKRLSIETRSDVNTRVDNQSNIVSERFIKKGIRVKLDDCVIKAGEYRNKTMTTEYLDDIIVKNGRTTNDFRVKAQFRNDQSGIDQFIKKDVLFITKNYGFRRDLLEEELLRKKSITDLLLEWGDNQDSDNEMKEIFGENKPFDYSKPTKLIFNLIKSIDYSDNDIIVLDFFAGSGTTAHAVEKLNAEDNGNRKWILCQIDEPCEKENFKSIDQISRERIRRIGASFRAFKLDTSNYTEQFYTPSDWTKKEIWEHSKEFIKNERSIEDICFGIMLEKGIPLTAKISHTDYGIYAESENKMLFVVNKKLDTNAARETAEKIKEQIKNKSYVYIYPSSFIDDAAKINCIQFFENIENVELLEM